MSVTAVVIIILALAMIVGGILVLKKSAKKFDLSEDQLKEIKKRNQALDKAEQEEE